MKLGLNLSFATKRWMEPAELAAMCRNEFGVKHIQFTWDLIDPWWPEARRDALAGEYRKAFESEGMTIDATFGGIASYTYAQLLAPSEVQRGISFEFFKRAVDLTAVIGAGILGTPVGGMSYRDARDKGRRVELYRSMLGYLRKIAEYAKSKGQKKAL